MKKLTFLLALSIGLMSCSKNEVVKENISNDELNRLTFSTAIGKQTKAVELDLAGLQSASDGFKSIAYSHAGPLADLSAAPATTYFDLTVKHSSGDWVTTPSSSIYWPESGNKLSAFSYAPVTGPTYTAPTYSSKLIAPTLAYTVEADPANQKDLIAASSVNQDNTSSAVTGALNVSFKHILSQVRFRAAAADDSYIVKVTKIEVSGVKKSGTYSFQTSTTALGSWAINGADVQNHIYYENATGIECKTIPLNIYQNETTNNCLMLIPQLKNAGFTFTVTYSIYSKTGGELELNVSKSAEMEDLQMGVKYIYNLILPLTPTVSPIKFNVSVDTWATEKQVNVFYKIVKPSSEATLKSGVENAVSNLFTNVSDEKIDILTVTVSGTPKLTSDVEIDLSKTLNPANLKGDDSIIIDFEAIDFNSRKITLSLPTEWTATTAEITTNGKIKITKK